MKFRFFFSERKYFKSIAHLLFLLTFGYCNIIAQHKSVVFPSNLLIQPFVANSLKPKLGFEFKNSKNELSLNVGNSIDILHYKLDEQSSLAFGADLFTYTLLRSQSNFHFPVDAVDYLFGLNFGYSNNNYGARLRISHISAHFVDGHYNKKLNDWLDGREPKVYSREFIELIPFYSFDDFRAYAGFTYIFSIDPRNIGKDQYQIGIEYLADKLISKYLTPYLAYDIRLINIYGYSANNSIEAGIKYGYSTGKGFSLFLRYFSGHNIHGEYFDVRERFTSIGFNLDL